MSIVEIARKNGATHQSGLNKKNFYRATSGGVEEMTIKNEHAGEWRKTHWYHMPEWAIRI